MRYLRSRLSYANVMVTILAFIVLGGGAAFAASRIQAGEIATGAVGTRALHKRAVTSGKIAAGAVRGTQVANASLSSNEIKPGSIVPSSLEVPLAFVANPTGGSLSVPNGPGVEYPFNNASWTQGPNQINVIFGEAKATLAYTGSGGFCQAFIELKLNGRQVGGGEVSTSSESLVPVTGSLGANPEIDPPSTRTNVLTAQVFSNGNCTPESTIDSTRFKVLDFG
jgi:hypothetical protein